MRATRPYAAAAVGVSTTSTVGVSRPARNMSAATVALANVPLQRAGMVRQMIASKPASFSKAVR